MNPYQTDDEEFEAMERAVQRQLELDQPLPAPDEVVPGAHDEEELP